MKVRRKFLKLTKYTYPHGTENLLKSHLPTGYKEDGLGNFYLLIGNNPSTMFACHLDTASKKSEPVIHGFTGQYIHTNKKTILGADDKAGVVVLLSLIEKNIPGLYYFFIGEEVGCVGSGRLAKIWETTDFSNHIKKVVSFDRRGTDSVITQQMFGTCCSDEFAIELSKRLNMIESSFKFKPDPTGVFTDSAKFVDLVPECTNISVGYYDEHTVNEKQDIQFLEKLCKTVTQIDWETLPIKRKHDDYSNYSNYYDNFYSDIDIDINDNWSDKFFSYFTIGSSSKKMYIAKSHIEDEKEYIEDWLNASCAYPGYRSISWNGNSLYVDMEFMEHVGNRKELLDLIPKLATVPSKYLKSQDELFDEIW